MRDLPGATVVALVIVALASWACGEEAGPTFEITGIVVAGPTCPVQRTPPDPACADRPLESATILVRGPDGRVTTRARSAGDGGFTVRLTPGRYRFEPQPVEGLMGTAPPADIDVLADGKAVGSLRFTYDTGIR